MPPAALRLKPIHTVIFTLCSVIDQGVNQEIETPQYLFFHSKAGGAKNPYTTDSTFSSVGVHMVWPWSF